MSSRSAFTLAALLAHAVPGHAVPGHSDPGPELVGPELVEPELVEHSETAAGDQPFVVDGVLVGGGTTWGVVLAEGGEHLRVCEESFGEKPRVFYRAGDGRVLVGGARGLFSTTDGGCTWTPIDELSGASVGAIANVPDAPGTLLVATSTAEEENGVWRSLDGGATFKSLAKVRAGRLFSSIAVDDAGGRIVASGVDVTTDAPFLLATSDGGATFQERAPWAAGALLARALAVLEDGRTAVSILDEDARARLLLASASLASSEEIGAFPAEVTAFASFAGRRLAIVGRNALHVEEGPGAWRRVDGGPSRCLLRVPGDGRLWGCGQLRDLAHFMHTEDGLTWTGELPYGAVRERLCPVGTAGAQACAYTFFSAEPPARDEDEDGALPGSTRARRDDEEEPREGPVAASPRCACTSAAPRAGSAAAIALIALLTAVFRRVEPRCGAQGKAQRAFGRSS